MKNVSSKDNTRLALIIVLVTTVLFALSPVSVSAVDETVMPEKLVAGTMLFPPFAMKKQTGEWEGLSIDLLRAVARNLGTDFELRTFSSIRQIEKAVANGDIDLAPVASVTEELERIVDFSHPYYRSGSAIAVSAQDNGLTLFHMVERLFSKEFLGVVGLLLLVWLVAGAIVWMFENRKNLEMFDEKFIKGLGNGIWWAAVTMTTVGYGDKAPKTVGGRVVAIIWMFASVIMISSFTATITTSLTVGELQGKVRGFHDLPNVRVGILTDDPTAGYLVKNGVAARPYESLQAGLQALAKNRIDAFVHDKAILKHLVRTEFPTELRVLAGTFNHYYIGMGLPPDSKLREPLNRAMLKAMNQDDWEALLKRYLGTGN